MPAQAAFDNLAELPSWGQEIDEQVQQYIDGVRRVAQTNLVWRFKSGRYFGSEVETISATRTIYVSPLKAYLDEITARLGGKATEVM
ncbi:hypothetical protein N7528_004261 [Penicillium herquei]|nr:hypothetical protein N7528_004261 [Penicillium herquei]